MFVEKYLKENSNLEELDTLIESTHELRNINLQLEYAKRLLLSDEPDYRNAVKEAIGALESVLQKVLNDDSSTVGHGIKEIGNRDNLHPAFVKGLSTLYGFNSNAGGVRHGLKEEDYLPDYTDAKLLVNIYSSFINYLVERYNLR